MMDPRLRRHDQIIRAMYRDPAVAVAGRNHDRIGSEKTAKALAEACEDWRRHRSPFHEHRRAAENPASSPSEASAGKDTRDELIRSQQERIEELERERDKLSRAESALRHALTVANYALKQTREYVFSWRGPSEAEMCARIENSLSAISVALLVEIDAVCDARMGYLSATEAALQSSEAQTKSLIEALEKIASFQRARPSGAPGSYQRGYDGGFNNAGLFAAEIARSALSAISKGRGEEDAASCTESGGSPRQGAAKSDGPARAGQWRCGQCGCATYARVDEQQADGTFAPGPKVRCVECKAVTDLPTPGMLFCQAFADTFEGGGWAEAPIWENFDDEGKRRWERAAARHRELGVASERTP